MSSPIRFYVASPLTLSPDALRARLARVVQSSLGQFANHAALVTQANPGGSVAELLSRPDIQTSLAMSLASSRTQAERTVTQTWNAEGVSTDSPVFQSLLSDIQTAYDTAPDQITRAIARAHSSVPQEAFTPGISTPGSNPAYRAAVQRAQAVRDAINAQGSSLALRNSLSTDVAASSARAEAVLADARKRELAGEHLGKKWVASMDGRNPRSCAWCKRLHGVIVPLDAEFPYPERIGNRKPPKLYLGTLPACPLHPRCACHTEIVNIDNNDRVPVASATGELTQPDNIISSDEIASLPQERYDSLLSFLRSALHELSQVIAAILGIS